MSLIIGVFFIFVFWGLSFGFSELTKIEPRERQLKPRN